MTANPAPALVEMATKYVVSAVSLDGFDSDMFAVHVEWRGGDRWAVTLRSRVLTKGGEWVYEPNPSSRTPAFLKRTRFDLETALRLARREAPRVTVNGLTATAFRALAESEADR